MKVAWLWCFMFHRNQNVVTQNFIIEPTGDKYFSNNNLTLVTWTPGHSGSHFCQTAHWLTKTLFEIKISKYSLDQKFWPEFQSKSAMVKLVPVYWNIKTYIAQLYFLFSTGEEDSCTDHRANFFSCFVFQCANQQQSRAVGMYGDVGAVRRKGKNSLKTPKMHFLPVFELMLDSFSTI